MGEALAQDNQDSAMQKTSKIGKQVERVIWGEISVQLSIFSIHSPFPYTSCPVNLIFVLVAPHVLCTHHTHTPASNCTQHPSPALMLAR